MWMRSSRVVRESDQSRNSSGFNRGILRHRIQCAADEAVLSKALKNLQNPPLKVLSNGAGGGLKLVSIDPF